jgi:hypothetical protein
MDSRTERNTQFPLADLFPQSAYTQSAGCENINDATRLASDPTFRLTGPAKVWEWGVALTSTLHFIETDLLACDKNFAGLVRLNRELAARAVGVGSSRRVMLDMDSSKSSLYEEQDQTAYIGHFKSGCFQPRFLFTCQCHCLAAKFRPGHVHSAQGWEEVLLPEIERQQQRRRRGFGATQPLPSQRPTRHWKEERRVRYAIRLPANENLERNIEALLPRLVRWLSQKPAVRYKGLLYQTANWRTPRRVVANVELHAGELFPCVGFMVTNLDLPSQAVVRFHTSRWPAEEWIKGGKLAVDSTPLSCRQFREYEVHSWLSLIAYNLAGLLATIEVAQEDWELVASKVAQRLVDVGGRLVKRTRQYWLVLAEEHLTPGCYGGMFRRIAALRQPDA